MLRFIYSTSTLAFDSFGDIPLVNGDIVIKTERNQVIMQALVDFLKTTPGDYFFNQGLGANYDYYIGRGIDQYLVGEVVNKIKDDIYRLGIIPDSLFKVYGLKQQNTIQIRIILFNDDEYTIHATFDPSIGVSLGH